MNKRRAQEFRKLRAEELRRFAQILLEEEAVRDAGPLLSAAAMCARQVIIDRHEYWGYSFHGLEFYDVDMESLRHARPEGADELKLELSIALKGPCLDDNSPDDPFTILNVDFVTVGRGTDGRELRCAWHLDKHIKAVGDNPSTLVHPDYHFQHGGKNVWSLNDYGSSLILETPRLPHPPLDAILAVDFILSNYYGKRWESMHIDNSDYQDLVKAAQERCWMPYAFSTATICKTIVATSPWKPKLIWPQLVLN